MSSAPVGDGIVEVDLSVIRQQVEDVLDTFVRRKVVEADGQPLAPMVALLKRVVVVGGKRLRPLLCCLGWSAAGGVGRPPSAVLEVAAALELFHAFALIHDDVMDGSSMRRGRPTVHRAAADYFTSSQGREQSDRLGEHAAVLIGDLAFVWSDELLHRCALTPGQLRAVMPLVDGMRSEIMLGQYLDLRSAGSPCGDVDGALRIARLKSGSYSVERPLQIGAALAGGSGLVLAACSSFARPLGEAFQLRDDVLGAFGDPAVTGKSAVEDLRAGKHTVLSALAWRRASADQRSALSVLLGNRTLTEDDAVQARALLAATGALAEVEEMIRSRHRQALAALHSSGFPGPVDQALRQIADAVTAGQP
ncbi:polyprenyl synthetase family protein [Streptomyces sp. NPDC020096]